MLSYHKGHTDTIQVYSVTAMTHVKALEAGQTSQGTPEPITPGPFRDWFVYFKYHYHCIIYIMSHWYV